jgi:hypothetical protein
MPLRRQVQFTILTILAWCVCELPAVAQSQNKLMVWPKEPGRGIRPAGIPGGQSNALAQFDSFEIEDITVEGKSILIGQPFVASDDWLNAVTVRIKNVSQQKFQTIQMTLILPEIKISPQIPVCYGCASEERRKGFGPGEEVELRTIPSDKFYNWVKTSITKETSLSSITTAEIHITLAVLADGSEWLSQCVKTANRLNACPHPGAP